MHRLLPIVFLLLLSSIAKAQQDFFVLKKGNRTIRSYREGFYIAFQTRSKEWTTGTITKIKNDSFAVRPMIVRYHLMGSDTTYYPILSFHLDEVKILPKRGLKIDYMNGRFQINRGAGHMHFYWVKSGLLFRLGGMGYAALHLINGLIENSLAFSWNTFGIAAGVFLIGEILHHTYKVTMQMGKKYHLQSIKVAEQGKP